MQLTRDNYYGTEADMEYLSCSQYEEFISCEARAIAKLDERFKPEPSEAFLVGNYFHSYFEGPEAHQEFLNANFDSIFKTKETKARGLEITGKYAPFVKADQMIMAAESEPMIKKLIDMPGENERIMTGMLFGEFPWKIRLDKYIPDKRMIIDWKTVANIWDLAWNSEYGQKVSFIENFNYMMRAAVYMEIEKQVSKNKADPTFMLVCISKQDPPDKEIILLNHRQRLDLELETVYEHLRRIMRLKRGEEKPKRCGYCEYCRGTKRLTDIISYYNLEPGNRPQKEVDYAVRG